MNPVELVKAHPVVAGVSALAVVAALVLFVGAKGATSSDQVAGPMVGLPSTNTAGANDAILAGVQLQAIRTQSELESSKAQAEKDVAMAKIAADSATFARQALSADLAANNQFNLGKLTLASNTQLSTLQIAAQKAIALQAGGTERFKASLAFQAQNIASVRNQNLEMAKLKAAIEAQKINAAPNSLWALVFGK